MHAAGLVAAATGATLLASTSFARMDRGAGRPCPTRLPYFPQEAVVCVGYAVLFSMYEIVMPCPT